jgi:hypothetical protein
VGNKTGEHAEESDILLDELWVGFEDFPNYEVSNYGRVVNIRTGRDLSPSKDQNGFYHVALYHKGCRTDVMALVAYVLEAFVRGFLFGMSMDKMLSTKEEGE